MRRYSLPMISEALKDRVYIYIFFSCWFSLMVAYFLVFSFHLFVWVLVWFSGPPLP